MSIKNLESVTGQDSSSVTTIFAALRPGKSLVPIEMKSIPYKAKSEFDWMANLSLDIPSVYENKVFQILNEDSGKLAFVVERRISCAQHVSPFSVHVFEFDESQTPLGYGQFGLSLSQKANPASYVMQTDTYAGFVRQGHALERLYDMNALSRAIYGLPLASGIAFEHPSARSRWQMLVERGHAIKIEGPKDKYIFL